MAEDRSVIHTMMSSSLYAGSLPLLPSLPAQSYCSTASVYSPADLRNRYAACTSGLLGALLASAVEGLGLFAHILLITLGHDGQLKANEGQ